MFVLICILGWLAMSTPLMAASVGGSGGGTQGLDDVITADRTYGGAVSQATALRIGDSVAGEYWLWYRDPTAGLTFVCEVAGVPNDCNYVRKLASGKYYEIQDSTGAQMIRFVPGGATPRDKYPFGSSHYPLKSFYVDAWKMHGDGANCPSRPTVVTISNMSYATFICSENNSSRMKFAVPMRGNWDGGVIYLKIYYSQTAVDTGSVALEVAAACRAVGTAFNGTYGTEVDVDDAVLAGSGAIESTLSAAITPNGTCAGSDWLFVYIDVDATDLPTTAAATLNFLGADLFYSETSLSH